MSSKKNSIKRRKVRIILFFILLIAVLFQFIFLTAQSGGKFFSRGYQKEYQGLKNAYYSSQYAKKDAPGIIPDETFESFAAGAFLKGMNPIHIVHDHPPMGRYLLSLSIVLFDNPRTLIIFFMLASFLGIFLISYDITKNALLSLIPVAIFANEPLTLNKLAYAPLPEPVQLPFIIFAFYFFMLGLRSKNKVMYYACVSILLGFVISIRFFVTGGLMVMVMAVFLLFFRRNIKELILFVGLLPLSLLVLIASYLRTIQDGYSVLQIFGVQKYILAYHKSAFTNAFSFWDLILFNRWHTWWGTNAILSDSQWRLFWPISVIITTVASLFSIIAKIKLTDDEKVLVLWVGGYSLMLSTGYTSTRYFFPLLPFLYILMVSGGVKLYYFISHAKKN